MHWHCFAITLLALSLVSGCAQTGRRSPADLIVTNAKVWTADADRAAVTAFVVRDGRFVYVGDDDGVRRYEGSATRVVDAGGARVVPGMIDSHLHLISGGLNLDRLNLRNVPDRQAFIAAIAARAEALQPGEWILGGRWSTESWPDATQPTKEWVDSVTLRNPILLDRMDGHGALANAVALKIAGIDRDGPPDPPGGRIMRNPETNEPTGILKESAIELVERHVPESSSAEKMRALKAAMREANRYGVTTVHTMSPWSDVATLDAARASGELTLRVRPFIIEDDWREYIDRAKGYRADDWLRVVGFKQFMDGSLGSRTAYMAEPFADNPPHNPDNRGLLGEVMANEGRLQAMCNASDTAGFSPALHCIGDQANHMVLDIYAATQAANGPRGDRLMRIEHAQHLLPSDIPRFAALGVIASMQPLHKADDGRYAEKAIGAERCRTSYAFRSLLDLGALVAFGSDWPVVSLNPFLGIHAAVTGKTFDGKVFVPEQSITVEEALRCYAVGGARAAGDGAVLGQIKVGFLADFVILDRDVLSAPHGELKNTTVQATYVNGRCVWAAE
ncbi:MAG: amidohydrolase [Planctomycetota bacterium]